MSQPLNPLEDLSEIRSMMERSSKIPWLSGLAGIIIGVFALGGVFCAQWIRTAVPASDVERYLIMDAVGILLFAFVIALYLSIRLAKRKGWPIVTGTAKHFILDFGVPLLCGGIVCIALLLQRTYFLLPSTMLLFYGLALFNISKVAVPEIRYLAFTEVVLGLLAAFFPDEGMSFWAAGFGVVHIVYGARIYLKHEQ